LADQAPDSATYDLLGAAALQSPDVQVFMTPGSFNWVKPAGARTVQIICIGAGGGGGSGRRGAAASVRCGGGAGGSGGYTDITIPATALGPLETITVGAGGAGGGAVTANDTNGNAGSNGGPTQFGTLRARGGAGYGGSGGTNAIGTSGGGGVGAFTGVSGGAASTTGGTGANGPTGSLTGAGGGGGGGVTSADVASNGGPGGSNNTPGGAGGTAGVGAAGGNGLSTTNGFQLFNGTGGGGGGASIVAAAFAGGNGGTYGAGGGGGGASLNGNNSGAGGAGGNAAVMVISYPGAGVDDPSALVAWGDSLTAGTTPNTPYTTPLQALLPAGVTVINRGVGGEKSGTIAARQGGQPFTVTVTGNSIPASGSVVVTPSVPTPNASGTSLDGYLGGVFGTMTYSAGTITFTRQTTPVPSATKVPSPATFAPAYATALRFAREVIWAGRNDYADLSPVAGNIAAMVAYNRSGKSLVLSVLNDSAAETIGTPVYNNIIALNAQLSTIYGSSYLDIRAYLIAHGLADAGITPTTQDTTDIANDCVPISLRAAGDTLHLNTAGYTVVAQQVAAKMTALGW
jgi:lysophospholipase L1-like esterase